MRNLLCALTIILIITNISMAQDRGMQTKDNNIIISEKPYRTSWALLIGINKYPNLPNQLNYAVNDVQDLRKVLIEQYQFPESNITTLINEQATRQKINDAMSQLADSSKVKSDDCVLVFFSGHGQTVPLPRGGEMGFILPYDTQVKDDSTNPSAYYNTCLSMDELKRLASMIPAKHILFLIDSCYSGLAISPRGGLSQSVPGYLRKVASLPVQQIITAGMKGEQSYEKPEWGHGAFTYKLLEALRTGVADENEDGVITGFELASYLKNVVPNISPNQTPQYGYFDGEGEFLFLRSMPDGNSTTASIYRLDFASPAGFKISIDGKQTGQETPAIINVSEGQHTVTLTNPDFETYEKTVMLSANNPMETINAIVKRKAKTNDSGYGILFVKASAEDQPTTATVFVNNKEVGSAPYTNQAIAAGSYEVRVSKPLYRDYKETITIAKDRKQAVNAILKPAYGSLEINSTPSGAIVELYDVSGTKRGSGSTSFSQEKIPSGKYKLKLNKDRYYPEIKDITILDGKKTTEALLLKPKFGTLSVESIPAGAKVLLAGKELGKTPLKLEVDSGKYLLELQEELYLNWSGEVNIRDGETSIASQKLPPNFGTLDVQVSPKGSQIVIDGKLVGQTPAKLRLAPGTHHVEISRDKMVPLVYDSVLIGRDQIETLNGAMERKIGTLRVNSKPPEACITVDGEDYGTTPNILQLPIGNYNLKLSKESFRDYMEAINIEWNKSLERNINLPIGPPPNIRAEMVIRSFFLPGWGQYYGKRYISGTTFLLMELGAITGSVISYMQYEQSVDKYKKAVTRYNDASTLDDINFAWQAMVSAHKTADKNYQIRQAMYIAVGGVWALNLLYAIIAGAPGTKPIQEQSPSLIIIPNINHIELLAQYSF